MLILTKKFHFNAAHRFPRPEWSQERNRDVFGSDHRNPDHTYELEVSLAG